RSSSDKIKSAFGLPVLIAYLRSKDTARASTINACYLRDRTLGQRRGRRKKAACNAFTDPYRRVIHA
ncbi:hypothetical protein, partial [Ramlibacter sp.]|uniref:hypothetical protein n=1 Tax=Ramlibacter sp. TaxID=1917967 RepID=UPI0025F0075C